MNFTKRAFINFLICTSILFVGIFLFSNIVLAQTKPVEIYFFYVQGCPYCAAERSFLRNLQEKYPSILVKEYDAGSDKNNAMVFSLMSRAYGSAIPGTPTVFVGDKMIDGYNEAIGQRIENKVEYCLQNECVLPSKMLNNFIQQMSSNEVQDNTTSAPKASITSVFTALIAGIVIVGVVGFGAVKLLSKKT